MRRKRAALDAAKADYLQTETAKSTATEQVRGKNQVTLIHVQEEVSQKAKDKAAKYAAKLQAKREACRYEIPKSVLENLKLESIGTDGKPASRYAQLSDVDWEKLANGLPVAPVNSFAARWAALSRLSTLDLEDEDESAVDEAVDVTAASAASDYYWSRAKAAAPHMRYVRYGLFLMFAVLSLLVLAGKQMLHPAAKEYYEYGVDPTLEDDGHNV